MNDEQKTQFAYLQKVRVIDGFYKGYKGQIVSYTIKNGKIVYKLTATVNGKPLIIDNVAEESIKKLGLFY